MERAPEDLKYACLTCKTPKTVTPENFSRKSIDRIIRISTGNSKHHVNCIPCAARANLLQRVPRIMRLIHRDLCTKEVCEKCAGYNRRKDTKPLQWLLDLKTATAENEEKMQE